MQKYENKCQPLDPKVLTGVSKELASPVFTTPPKLPQKIVM
jgi:hypothetical protein